MSYHSCTNLSRTLQVLCPRGLGAASRHVLRLSGGPGLVRPYERTLQRRWLQFSSVSLRQSPPDTTIRTAGPTVPSTSYPATVKKPPTSASDAVPTEAQQRRMDFNILKDLLINVWPKHGRETKIRVVVALSLLIGGKVSWLICSKNGNKNSIRFLQLLNVQVPFLFKSIVDTLNVEFTSGATVWVVAGSLIAGCMLFFFYRSWR